MNDWLLEILKTKEDYYDKIIAKERRYENE